MTEHDPQQPERPGAGAESPPVGGAGPSPRPEPPPAGTGGDEATTRIPPGGAGRDEATTRIPPGDAGGTGEGTPPPPPPPPPPPAVPRRRLYRSKQRRVLAGVAGGLGEYTGVDPVLYRVLFAVLTVFGGAGILLYILAWLFLPEQDQATSPAESLIGRGRAGDTVQAVLLAIAAFALAGLLLRGDVGDLVLILVVAIGGILLARHLDERRDGTPPGQPGQPAPPPYQPYQAYEYQPYDPVPTATATGPGATATATYPPVPKVEPPKERSVLGRITLSLLLLVLGVTAALDAADVVDPQARHYLALSVGLLGLGLVVGAWRGRARGLVWLGIPLTVALVAVGTADVSLDGGAGDRQYRPLSVAEVRDRYEVGVGNLELDLSDLDFTGRAVRTTASAGIGHVQVLVPREVDVEVAGRAGIGQADLFGEQVDDSSLERTVVDDGPDGEGGGRLELVLEVGVGKVEVDRAAA